MNGYAEDLANVTLKYDERNEEDLDLFAYLEKKEYFCINNYRGERKSR